MVAKPNTPAGRHRSIASRMSGPVWCESMASSPWPDSAWLSTIRPAACGTGNADRIRSVPRERGSVSRCFSAANRLRCECTTALGTPVVPEEWVIATGSSGWCRYGAGAASGSAVPSLATSVSTGAAMSCPASWSSRAASPMMPAGRTPLM